MKKLILMLLVFAPLTMMAQKFGHVNTQEVIQAMPEFTKARQEIEALQKQYEDDLKGMQEELKKKAEAFDKEQATLPDVIKQRREQASAKWHQNLESTNDRNRLIKMYEALQAEIRTAENNILFFTSKTGNALVAGLQKKIDELKKQAQDIENKINDLDNE